MQRLPSLKVTHNKETIMAYKKAYQKEVIKNYELRKENLRLKQIIEKLISCGGKTMKTLILFITLTAIALCEWSPTPDIHLTIDKSIYTHKGLMVYYTLVNNTPDDYDNLVIAIQVMMGTNQIIEEQDVDIISGKSVQGRIYFDKVKTNMTSIFAACLKREYRMLCADEKGSE